MASPDHMCTRSCVTVEDPEREVEAMLRVSFPEAMRSIVFEQVSDIRTPDTLVVEYRLDEGRWLDAPRNVVMQARVPATGARAFELRAWMVCPDRPQAWGYVEFLRGYFDVPKGKERPPCFSIVADPVPGVARLPP